MCDPGSDGIPHSPSQYIKKDVWMWPGGDWVFSCADILTFFSCMKQLFLFEETVAYFPAQESMGRWLIFLWDQACVLLMPSVMCYWFYLHHLLSFCGLVIQCDSFLAPSTNPEHPASSGHVPGSCIILLPCFPQFLLGIWYLVQFINASLSLPA